MKKIETLCVHPLPRENDQKGSVTSVIYPSTAYNYLDNDLQYPGFYSAYNQTRLGEIIAKLELGAWGMVFSSGMAAISTAILSFVQQGDHVVFAKELYGGTMHFAQHELPKRNIHCSFAGNSLESFQASIRKNTRIIYIETPSNPLLKIISLADISELARKNNIITIVDNTFASPVNQTPLSHGIDISIHSGTKYLGGHNDLPFGALAASNQQHKDAILATAKLYGGSLAPQQCYQVERSLKTLALRINKHNQNALKLAEFLTGQQMVNAVYYPGLSSHPQHLTAKKQMNGFGGLLSFELNLPPDRIRIFLKNLSLIQPALSLGGVESLICAPSVTSHRLLSAEQRSELGIKDSLLRFSVGVEDADDLISDLRYALTKAIGSN